MFVVVSGQLCTCALEGGIMKKPIGRRVKLRLDFGNAGKWWNFIHEHRGGRIRKVVITGFVGRQHIILDTPFQGRSLTILTNKLSRFGEVTRQP